MNKDDLFLQKAQQLNYRFDGDIKIGGNYTSLVQDIKIDSIAKAK